MPSSPRHKNIRLDSRNYVGFGGYFLTLCTYRRAPYFRASKIARWLLRVLRDESAGHSFHLRAYCLMPDHLHLLLQSSCADAKLLAFVQAFKHKTSFRFRARTGKTLWQTSFYDHILRDHEAPDAVAWYIWSNPLRAGLVTSPFEYPYSGPRDSQRRPSAPPTHSWSPPASAARSLTVARVG